MHRKPLLPWIPTDFNATWFVLFLMKKYRFSENIIVVSLVVRPQFKMKEAQFRHRLTAERPWSIENRYTPEYQPISTQPGAFSFSWRITEAGKKSLSWATWFVRNLKMKVAPFPHSLTAERRWCIEKHYSPEYQPISTQPSSFSFSWRITDSVKISFSWV